MDRRAFLAASTAGGLVASAAGGPARGEGYLFGRSNTERLGISTHAVAEPRLTKVARGLDRPWCVAATGDGHLLVTERGGRLQLLEPVGSAASWTRRAVAGGPAPTDLLDHGLLSVAADPDFAANRTVYLTFMEGDRSSAALALGRGELDGAVLRGFEVLLRTEAGTPTRRYGGRLAFDDAGHLYLSTGDHGRIERAMDLRDLRGKILRLDRDGRPAPGNPYEGLERVRPEIYSRGHNAPQGLAFDPASGQLWSAERAGLNGDEVNRVDPGDNHGYSVVSAAPVRGLGLDAPEPEALLRPATINWGGLNVSPSGLSWYPGEGPLGLAAGLLVAAPGLPALIHLPVDGDGSFGEERRFLADGFNRVRHVATSPEGEVFVVLGYNPGAVFRLDSV